MTKRTAIIGASTNPSRYAYLAATRLKAHQHEIVPLGIHKGVVAGVQIEDLSSKPDLKDIHTLTMYINPSHQAAWEDYLLSLHPKRIIFNPGSENSGFEERAKKQGIETLHACTLVMLSTGQF